MTTPIPSRSHHRGPQATTCIPSAPTLTSSGPSLTTHSEGWCGTLNPQVLGSNPRGRTNPEQALRRRAAATFFGHPIDNPINRAHSRDMTTHTTTSSADGDGGLNMTHWNYRVIHHSASLADSGDVIESFEIMEVYYCNDRIVAHAEANIVSDDLSGLQGQAKRMLAAANHPVIEYLDLPGTHP